MVLERIHANVPAGRIARGFPLLVNRVEQGQSGALRMSGNLQNNAEEVLAEFRHHLRTPLNHIIGYCEMLLEEDLSLEAQRRAQTILAEAMKINSLMREARMDEAA